MKTHLDQLMQDRNLDSFIVMGDTSGNPVMQYLAGPIHLERAIICKRRGGPLTLIHGSMERDNAAQTSMDLIDRDQVYNLHALIQKHEGNRLSAQLDYLLQVIADFALNGRLGFYGQGDLGATYLLLNALADRLENTEIAGEWGETLFTVARETKDASELAELAALGRRTCRVVGEVQEFLQAQTVRDGIVTTAAGQPMTIEDVRHFLRRRLYEQELFEDHKTIFAQGHEAAVPHNAGSDDQVLRLGEAIIFDIFPKGASGYFYDMTRTWSLGYATDHVWEAWEQTKTLLDQVLAGFRVGQRCSQFQVQACDFYEAHGHKTIRSHPGTHEGYVHSLGHGIGLDIHEGPNLNLDPGNRARLEPGHVITVEPGLYYPERGFGVRVEDAVAFDPDGNLINLTDYPYDLVIPMPRA